MCSTESSTPHREHSRLCSKPGMLRQKLPHLYALCRTFHKNVLICGRKSRCRILCHSRASSTTLWKGRGGLERTSDTLRDVEGRVRCGFVARIPKVARRWVRFLIRAPDRSNAGLRERESSRGVQTAVGDWAKSRPSPITFQSPGEEALRKEVGAMRSRRTLNRARSMGAEAHQQKGKIHVWTCMHR